MSRSTKKPIYRDGQNQTGVRRKARQRANRRVRAADELPSGNTYKKVSSSWDISDWTYMAPKTDKKASRK